MDIVLEFADGLFFDRAYAYLWPALPGPSSLAALTRMGAKPNSTATWAHIHGLGRRSEAYHGLNNYRFHRASQLISMPPTRWAYETGWPRDNPWRQLLSLYLITWIFGIVTYFLFAGLSYAFVFDKNTRKHPRFLKNQVRLEIVQSLISLPLMAVFTAPLFWLEVRGLSKLYDVTADGPGRWYDFAQFPFFLAFTDYFIYWIHRGLHHPLVYKRLHKPHHKWIMPTPFASHAFHPLDGFAQSVPYHVYPFLFPLQKWAYVVLFVFINIWTVLIHDGEFLSINPVVNGAACHTIHHIEFQGNYGQFSTLPDRLGGTYKQPPVSMLQRGWWAKDKDGNGKAETKKEK